MRQNKRVPEKNGKNTRNGGGIVKIRFVVILYSDKNGGFL